MHAAFTLSDPPELSITETVTISLEDAERIVRAYVTYTMNWDPQNVGIVTDARTDQFFVVSHVRHLD
jgi:hypothetical protein